MGNKEKKSAETKDGFRLDLTLGKILAIGGAVWGGMTREGGGYAVFHLGAKG